MEEIQSTSTNVQEEKLSVWKKVKIVIATLLALFLVVLIVQNWAPIHINLIISEVNIPLPALLFFALLTGYLWGNFSSYKVIRKREREVRILQKKIIDSNNM
jgi:uncharacterized integral membrane protein